MRKDEDGSLWKNRVCDKCGKVGKIVAESHNGWLLCNECNEASMK